MSAFLPVPLLWRVTAVVVVLHVGAIVAERLIDVSRRTGVLRQLDLNAEATPPRGSARSYCSSQRRARPPAPPAAGASSRRCSP